MENSSPAIQETTAVVSDDATCLEYYYDEETVVEDMEDEVASVFEEVVVSDSPSRFLSPSQRKLNVLIPLNENEVVDKQGTLFAEEEEEEAMDMEVDFVLDQEDTDDDASSCWIDDGRDHTKDPNIAPLYQSSSAFDQDSADDDEIDVDDNFYLDLPNVEDVSSLEDNLSEVGNSSHSSLFMEEIIEEASKRILIDVTPTTKSTHSIEQMHQSADWDLESIGVISNEDTKDDDDNDSHNDVADTVKTKGTLEEEKRNDLGQQQIIESSQRSSVFNSSRREHFSNEAVFVGRDKELGMLRHALNDTMTAMAVNPKRLVWIHGKSGIGKTALVSHFIRHNILSAKMSREGTNEFIFGSGNFDDHPLSYRPFSGLVTCLTDIMGQLVEEDGRDKVWSRRFQEGLGQEGYLLARIIPNLSQLLKDERLQAKNEDTFDLITGRIVDRMRFVLRRLFRIVCRHRKVVIFLDDLHLADEDSLRMIESILSTHALSNFFAIGCHKGIKSTHVLSRIKIKLQNICAIDTLIQPLADAASTQIIISLLKQHAPDVEINDIDPFYAWIRDRTSHEPQAIKELLAYLISTNKIRTSNVGWVVNLATLDADTTIPKSTTDLVRERIKHIDEYAKSVLKGAGFLNRNHFNCSVLYQATQVCFLSELKQTGDDQMKDIDSVVQTLDFLVKNELCRQVDASNFSFANENVRKSATTYLQKSHVKQKAAHFEFATYQEADMMSKSQEEKSDILPLIVEHFALASGKVRKGKEQIKLANYYLQLARESFQKAALSMASVRLENGLSILNENEKDGWQDAYDTSLSLHMELARVRFCQRKYDETEEIVNKIIQNAKSPQDKVDANEVLICAAITIGDPGKAFRIALLALKELFNFVPGDVEDTLKAIQEILKGMSDTDLSRLKKITHKKSTSKLHFLARLAEIAWMKQDFLHQDLAALQMVEITLRYGASKYSSLSFALYGMCLARRNLHQEAFQFGNLGAMTATEESTYGSQAITFHHYAVAYWKRPFQASLNPLKKVCSISIQSNDMENASFRVGALLSHIVATGGRLDTGDSAFRQFKEHTIAFKGRDAWLATIPFRLILRLRGQSIKPAQQGFEPFAHTRAVQYNTFFQMIFALVMNDIGAADKLNGRIFNKPDGIWLPMRGFYEGLISTSLAQKSTGILRKRHQRKAAKIVEVLGGWAKTGLKQVYHMAILINIELRILSNDSLSLPQLSTLYDSAILAAKKAGFIHHEAIANERAGMLFYQKGEDVLAAKYFTVSFKLFEKWGAKAKIIQLRKDYPRHLDVSTDPEQGTILEQNKDMFAANNSQSNLDFGESQIFHFDPVSASGGRGMARQLSRKGRASLNEPLANHYGRGRGRGCGPGRGAIRSNSRKTIQMNSHRLPTVEGHSNRFQAKVDEVSSNQKRETKKPSESVNRQNMLRTLSWSKKKKSKESTESDISREKISDEEPELPKKSSRQSQKKKSVPGKTDSVSGQFGLKNVDPIPKASSSSSRLSKILPFRKKEKKPKDHKTDLQSLEKEPPEKQKEKNTMKGSTPKVARTLSLIRPKRKQKLKDRDTVSVDMSLDGERSDEDENVSKLPVRALVKSFSWNKLSKKDKHSTGGEHESNDSDSDEEALKEYFNSNDKSDDASDISDGEPTRPTSTLTGLGVERKEKLRRRVKSSVKKHKKRSLNASFHGHIEKPKSLSSGLDAHSTDPPQRRSRSRSSDPSRSRLKEKNKSDSKATSVALISDEETESSLKVSTTSKLGLPKHVKAKESENLEKVTPSTKAKQEDSSAIKDEVKDNKEKRSRSKSKPRGRKDRIEGSKSQERRSRSHSRPSPSISDDADDKPRSKSQSRPLRRKIKEEKAGSGELRRSRSRSKGRRTKDDKTIRKKAGKKSAVVAGNRGEISKVKSSSSSKRSTNHEADSGDG